MQLAADIKTLYSNKRVVLIHSRDRLLPKFGIRLHNYVAKKLIKMGVTVMLNEQPQLPTTPGRMSLNFTKNSSETFDLVVRSFPFGSSHTADSLSSFHVQARLRTRLC